MLDGLDDESLDSPVEENSSPQFSRSAFVATPSGTPKSDQQVQKGNAGASLLARQRAGTETTDWLNLGARRPSFSPHPP